MDDRYYYYRPNGFGPKTLVYYFVLADKYLRTLFHLGPYCGSITTITCFLFAIIVTYTITSWAIFLINTKKFNEMNFEAQEKLPRRANVMEVRPAYNCLNKHLQQKDIFLDKTTKVIRKEQLEIEIMQSRIDTVLELLNLQDNPDWTSSRSPKGYFRDLHISMNK